MRFIDRLKSTWARLRGSQRAERPMFHSEDFAKRWANRQVYLIDEAMEEARAAFSKAAVFLPSSVATETSEDAKNG